MKQIKIINILQLTAICILFVTATRAQDKTAETKNESSAMPPISKKANQRPAIETSKTASEPFDRADVKTMQAQCVKLETEAGSIELEMFPETAPETVRNFLNLAAIGAFDTTVFSRVVPGFIVQGGNLSTRQNITPELAARARRTIPDEPNLVKHERGIVSMARSETPNSATTHFFILVGDAPNLDGTFAAFGRVIKGMDVVDAINKMPVAGDKPLKPVRLTRASVAPCPAQTTPLPPTK